MAELFISHSSKDAEFVRRLANDLEALGHKVWLDEWRIQVGDDIIAKIEDGLRSCDYVIVVLSKLAVESGWVDREWKARYWDEVSQNRVIVLPILLEDCQPPMLLRAKKYADFRTNYGVALVHLVSAIDPVVRMTENEVTVEAIGKVPNLTDKAAELLSKLNSGQYPLSQVIAETLTLADAAHDAGLSNFCRQELAGTSRESGPVPEWRCVQAYVSATARLNLQYMGFGGNAQIAWEELESDKKDFTPRRMCIQFPLAQLESHPDCDPRKTLMCMTLRLKDFAPDTQHPDAPVYAYLPGDTNKRVLVAIKAELTKRLLRLLPGEPT